MSSLKEFASFLKNHRMDPLIETLLELARSLELPLLRFLGNVEETQLKELTRTSLLEMLTGLETGTGLQIVEESLTNWDRDNIPGIPKDRVTLHDLLLGYYAQKLTLMKFIADYTSDARQMNEITIALEEFYLQIQQRAIGMLDKIETAQQLERLEKDERYRDLFDNATDMIHFASVEGNILLTNQAWQNALGYELSYLQGRSIYDFVVPEERDGYKAYREAVISGNKPDGRVVIAFMKKNGGLVIVEGELSCKFRDGQPMYTRGIFRDISRRIEYEKKLQFYAEQLLEREENFRNLITHAPDAVIVVNEQSIIQLWNPKAEQLFGWRSEEVSGESLVDTIIPVQYREAHVKGMARLLNTGESNILNKTIEITALNKDQKEFYISLTISRSISGSKNLFIAFLRDISTQKQNELELAKRRVQLERSNEELEQFAWLASHDLKEPLRKIMTFSDILVTRYSREINKDAVKYLEKITGSAHRMNKLIEGILLFSNISEESSLFESVNLSKILNEVLSDLEIAIKEKNAQFIVDDLPVIEAVPYQMQQLFQNLISNSLKYAKPDIPPLINISCRIPDGQRQVEIRFSDNGIGFDNLYSEKIFQVFQRLETSRHYEGTGIGLALCKKIVETHGGTIHAEGKAAEGAVFTFTLPLKHRTDKKNPHGFHQEESK